MKGILDEHLMDEEVPEKKAGLLYFIFLFLLIFGSIVSTFIAWEEIETIIGSGPVMSLIGITFTL